MHKLSLQKQTENSLQRCRLYKPSLKEGQQPRITVVTVMCSWLADRTSRLSSTATEVSWKLTLCSRSFLQTSSSPGQLLSTVPEVRFWAE
ncbi:hypothetical protein AMECASPLE_037685 [Ameca splendens]|uniref:Uncharacterized protein n=1 Tax=Ameca splendens TaxID=208324 RepID=A0ABV0ZV25_9TELE